MNSKEIRVLFPIEIEITEEHKKLAKKLGGLHYIGEILLKEKLPVELHEAIFWGLSIGSVQGVLIKTETKVKYNDKLHTIALYLDKSLQETNIKFELR